MPSTITGTVRLAVIVGITTSSPITVLGEVDFPVTVTFTTAGSAFSLVPVVAGSLALTPVTPATLGPLVPA